MKRPTWIVAAKTTGSDMLVGGASPEPASLDMVIRAGAAAAVTIQGPAGATIKSAWSVLGVFHGQLILKSLSEDKRHSLGMDSSGKDNNALFNILSSIHS